MVQLQALHTQSHVGAKLVGEIQRGMPVYDAEMRMLGIVARVCHGLANKPHLKEEEAVENLLQVPDMPPQLVADFREMGYIEIDTGLLSGNYFAYPYQIADVTSEGVFLLAYEDELHQY